MLHDIRIALRTFADQEAFISAALATVALGIGANVAIFSVVYGVLLRPLAYPDANRLVQLSEVVPAARRRCRGRRGSVTFPFTPGSRIAAPLGPSRTSAVG